CRRLRSGKPRPRRHGRARSHLLPAKTFDALAQEGDGIALFPDDAVAAFQNAGAVSIAEDFLRMRSRKGVAGDFLAAFHAFEEERVPRTLRDTQISADGGQQIRGENIVDRNEIALFGEALKFAEVRLDHGNQFTVDSSQSKVKSDYYCISGLAALARVLLDA